MLAKTIGAATLAVAVAASGPAGEQAEETLRALSMQPTAVTYTQSFLKFIDKVNAAGEGVVRIEFVGGPEAIPTFDQPEAVRAGVIDMIYGPASYYPGLVPETDALVGSNVTPMEKRANGGIDLLNQIHQEKMNVYLLGHPDGGIQFHIYMTKEPKLKADGLPDMSGIKLRGAPIYREFFTDYLGATFVQVNVPVTFMPLCVRSMRRSFTSIHRPGNACAYVIRATGVLGPSGDAVIAHHAGVFMLEVMTVIKVQTGIL